MNAKQEATVVEWLNAVLPGSAQVSSVREVVDSDAFAALALQMAGQETAGVAPDAATAAEALERVFAAQGHHGLVVLEHDGASLARAALGAAVRCERKQEYIRSMMELPHDSQAMLMELIEQIGQEAALDKADQLRAAVRRLVRENAALKEAETSAFGPSRTKSASVSSTDGPASETLNDKVRELERKLKAALNHAEEVEIELDEVKRESEQSKRVLSDKVEQYEEEVRAQADELDVARAKSAELVKAEAKISKLMQKLEETAQLRQQLKETQDENDTNFEKRLQVEAEVKSLSTLKQQVETYKNKCFDVESQTLQLQNELRSKEEELHSMRSKLKSANDREKFLKEQVDAGKESIAQLEAEVEMASGVGADSPKALNSVETVEPSVAAANHKKDLEKLDSRIAALEEENRGLEEEVESLRTKVKEQSFGGANNEMVQRLTEQLKEKESENIKLETEKEKLQNFIKASLSQTQAKYKNALKNLKAKYDEKIEIIENFQKIRMDDLNTHQREQRLMMSSFYELGLQVQRSIVERTQTTNSSWLQKSRKSVFLQK